ncbi:MAG TPA: sugar phosphate isomerase/epimerase [Pyrinomonadaceae bacterium]|jgi:2-keto-myo-inositol isomerase
MRLALNGATTMRADLAADVRAAAAAGFDCLEIWAAKLRKFLKSASAAELKSLLSEYGVEPYSINSIESITFRDQGGHARLLAECEELCRTASEINCPYIVVVPSPLPKGKDWDDVLSESVFVLDELGRTAEGYGVSLAFEFLGQPRCSVRTLGQAAEIVNRLGRANVGLVLDSFHFYAGGSRLESIAALDPRKLFVFHINDAEDLPREELEDRHRLLPGLGILPLKEIVAGLKHIGYDGVTSVEIFRPEYWERDPTELAHDAREATRRVLAGAGL